MPDEAMQVTLTLAGGADSDARELDELTGQLRRRLLELDVDSVERVRSDEVPERARPVDAVAIGGLIVTLTPSVLKSAAGLLEAWVRNRRVSSVTLTIDGDTIELSDAAPDQQERLVELFLEKHGQR